MNNLIRNSLAVAVAAVVSQSANAGTDTYFNPLTQSASVASPNHVNELTGPWTHPAGLSQENLTSLKEIEADINQSVGRAPYASTSASMMDMIAYDPSGKFLFIPHESPWSAGLSRYDIENDTNTLIFVGDGNGISCGNPGAIEENREETVTCANWSNDYAAFDPARFTPNGTVLLGEEWSGEGRIIEVMNPFADITNPVAGDPAADVDYRELQSIANVAHEGINFSEQYDDTIYYIDEWRSGSIYKFVMTTAGDYTSGQTFVLSVDAFNGDPADYYNDGSNVGQPRTGMATWVAITDADGNPLPGVTDPFRNGPTNDPRSNDDTRGGRIAADDVNGTPYGRPEDMEVAKLPNGNEILYITATSENTIYSVEILDEATAMVGILADGSTPTNVGFPATTGFLNSPDNLAQDALGNIYIIEDAPNGSDVGGDIWFARDADNDGVAESLDHFMSIQVDGSEATGMIFNPVNPTEFVVAVQHPDSTNLDNVPEGFGDAVWKFDLTGIVPPQCAREDRRGGKKTCSNMSDYKFVKMLERAEKGKGKGKGKGHWRH